MSPFRLPDSALSLVVLALVFATLTPLPVLGQFDGTQFQVNTYTTGQQRSSAVAMAANGQFVVVWRSSQAAGDSDGDSIQGACFEANADPRGVQFQVNQYTTGAQQDPEVGIAGNGDFVVVWHSDGSGDFDGDGQSVQARRYNASCAPKANQFEVNTYTSGAQLGVGVGVADDASFIVLWRSNGSNQGDNSSSSVQARRFAANGTALDGTEFQVNTYTTSSQREGRAAFRGNGDFVVVFKSQGSADGDISGYSVHARRYAANGAALGTEFQVNTYTTNSQSTPDVAVQSDGDFLVVWASFSSNLGDNDGAIIGRLYNANGLPQTGEFRVNSYTPGSVSEPRVSVTPDDNFVVAWNQSVSPEDPDSEGVRSAFVGKTASPTGRAQVNVYTTMSQTRARLSVADNGQFVVSWHSYGSPGSDGDSSSVQARLGRAPFFLDGFESGNTSAWSSATP